MQKKKKVSKNKIIKKKPTPTIKLKTKISDDLEYMARTMLGEPVISVELTKDQMNVLYINADNSFSLYSTLSHLSIEELKELKEYWITKYFFALCQ